MWFFIDKLAEYIEQFGRLVEYFAALAVRNADERMNGRIVDTLDVQI